MSFRKTEGALSGESFTIQELANPERGNTSWSLRPQMPELQEYRKYENIVNTPPHPESAPMVRDLEQHPLPTYTEVLQVK